MTKLVDLANGGCALQSASLWKRVYPSLADNFLLYIVTHLSRLVIIVPTFFERAI